MQTASSEQLAWISDPCWSVSPRVSPKMAQGLFNKPRIGSAPSQELLFESPWTSNATIGGLPAAPARLQQDTILCDLSCHPTWHHSLNKHDNFVRATRSLILLLEQRCAHTIQHCWAYRSTLAYREGCERRRMSRGREREASVETRRATSRDSEAEHGSDPDYVNSAPLVELMI